MITDVHSHYLPLSSLQAGSGAPITAAGTAEGLAILDVLGARIAVPRELGKIGGHATDADLRGLDMRVVSVPPFAALYEILPDEAVRWSRFLNEAIAEAVAGFNNLVGFATVPMQAGGAAAAAELEEAVQTLGLAGVELLTSVCGQPIYSSEFDPLWATAQALDAPVLLHPHVASTEPRMRDFYLRNLVGNPSETALTGAGLLFGGVFDRYPGLSVILAHGGGALPWLVGRLEHGASTRTELRMLTARPRELLRCLLYDTVVFSPEVVRFIGEVIGFDRLVVGTDYPFDMAEPDPMWFLANSGLGGSTTSSILNRGGTLVRRRSTRRRRCVPPLGATAGRGEEMQAGVRDRHPGGKPLDLQCDP